MREDPDRQRERRAGEPAHGWDAVSSEPGAHDNLPLPLTSFVGREAELEEVRGMLRRGRLVTLNGVGGCGKTRLALEAARSFAGDLDEGSEGGEFPDGVWLVELDPLEDPSLVAREVASVLGVRERPGRELVRELAAALRDEGCLILLDNCEHLVGACAELAEGLLRRCPGLAVLATSREPLGVAGERVWPVPALSVPDSASLEAASRCESVRLFEERAAASSPDFELTEKNAPAVAEVCRRLEGMPLAIELAASRVRSLTVAQIHARLDDALGLLASGPRTTSPRQSTLRATIDWSHDLLSPPERALFRRLSVFSGGFTLEAAEAVCAMEGEGEGVLDLLSRLVDKSLVEARRTGEATRYRLQEVIHQYASEKLEEAGETGTMRRRHAFFFRDFAEEAEPHVVGGTDRELWLDLVDEDLDNLRAAMSWAADFGEAELGLNLSTALAWYWLRRGRLVEGRASVERALEVGAEPALEAAMAIHVCGGLAWAQGDRDAAGPLLGEALARFRGLHDDARFSSALSAHSPEECLGRGELTEALLTAFWFSSALSVYSFERLERGETEEALALAAESVAVERRISEGLGLARGLAALGLARMAAGDLDGAIAPLEESAAICRRFGDGWLLSYPLGGLTMLTLRAGDHERARSLAEESVRALRGLGEKWLLANSLALLAITLTARGCARRAATLFGASEAMRDAVGQEEVYAHYRADYERGVETARASLKEGEFVAAWVEGRAMGVEEAVSFALEEDESVPEEPSIPPLRALALGQARVEVGGAAVEASDWEYAKVAELFFYLISHPPRTKEQIGEDLWLGTSPSRLRNAFHSAMFRLRRALGPPKRIRFRGGLYAFDHTLPHTYFDVADFEEKTRQARQCAEDDPETAATLLEEAAELYRGDFLEHFAGGEWIDSRQQELRESYIEGQLLLGRLLSKQGKDSAAVRAYRRVTARNPYSVEAHVRLIRAYCRLGERGRAIQHYHDYVDTLRRDFGATPSPEVTALVERLPRGEEL